MTDDQPSEIRKILNLDINDKIARAADSGRRYTPTSSEWQRAKPWQRRRMTWPQEVLDAIRRERP